MMDYRIRNAVVSVCNGYSCRRERMFLAERRIKSLGPLHIWWPVDNGEWRSSAKEAELDAEYDAHLRQPLAEMIYLRFEVRDE